MKKPKSKWHKLVPLPQHREMKQSGVVYTTDQASRPAKRYMVMGIIFPPGYGSRPRRKRDGWETGG